MRLLFTRKKKKKKKKEENADVRKRAMQTVTLSFYLVLTICHPIFVVKILLPNFILDIGYFFVSHLWKDSFPCPIIVIGNNILEY